MTPRFSLSSLALTAVAGAALLSYALPAQSFIAYAAQGVEVAQIVPLTGPLANVGKEVNAITQATLEDFDKGSKTTQIALKTYDDGNVADKSTRLATQAVASAQALVSCFGSVGCLPQQKVSATAGVPLIGPIAGAAPLRGKAATTTYAVRASASSEVACLLNFASTTGLSNVSLLVQDDGFGKSYAAELDKAAPGFPALKITRSPWETKIDAQREYPRIAQSAGMAPSYLGFESYLNARALIEAVTQTKSPTKTELVRWLDNAPRLDLGGYSVSYGGDKLGSNFTDLALLRSDGTYRH